MNTKEVADALSEVIDPELGIDIVSLGLLYGIGLDDAELNLQIALTSPDCPMGDVLLSMIAAKARRGACERRVAIEVVEDPPWNIAMLSESARRALGLPALK